MVQMLKEIDKEVAVAGRLQADRVGWEEKEGERRATHRGRRNANAFSNFLEVATAATPPPPASACPPSPDPSFSSLSFFATTHSTPIQVTSLAGGLSNNAQDSTSKIVFPDVK